MSIRSGENNWFYWFTINDNRKWSNFLRKEVYGRLWRDGRFVFSTRHPEKSEKEENHPWPVRVFGPGRTLLYFSWSFFKNFCRIGFSLNPSGSDDEPIVFYLALPWLFSFHLGLPLPQKWQISGYEGREFDLRVFDWSLWWNFNNSDMSWSSEDPWWQSGRINFKDLILGKWKCTTEEIGEPFMLKVPMLEGHYEIRVQRERRTWTRPRWFPFSRESYDIAMEKGIPFPGKGENGWDCGDDGLYGMSVSGDKNDAEIVAAVVETVLKSRLRYGGANCLREPYKLREVDHSPGNEPPPTPMQEVS